MLDKIAGIFQLRAERLLRKSANTVLVKRFEKLSGWFSQFNKFYKTEFLTSERLRELEEDEPQVYFTVANIAARMEQVFDALSKIMSASKHSEISNQAFRINQQATNVNEEIDVLMSNPQFEDIFEVENADVSNLIGNFLQEVAEIMVIKNNEVGEEDEPPAPILNKKKEIKKIIKENPDAIFHPEEVFVGTLSDDVVENTEGVETVYKSEVNRHVESEHDAQVQRYVMELEARRARSQNYRKNKKKNPEYIARQRERDLERRDGRRAKLIEYNKKYDGELKSTKIRLNELENAHNQYLALHKDHAALNALKENNRPAFDEILSKSIEYRRLMKDNTEFEKENKKLKTLERRQELRREFNRSKRKDKLNERLKDFMPKSSKETSQQISERIKKEQEDRVTREKELDKVLNRRKKEEEERRKRLLSR